MAGRILPLFLLFFSVAAGLITVLSGTLALFFYTTGASLLLIVVSLLFLTSLLLWRVARQKPVPRDPEPFLRLQAYLFRLWFVIHNLFWALVACFSIWGLFRVFGPRGWVLLWGAGAVACVVFAFFGIFIRQKQKMLALCWAVALSPQSIWEWLSSTFIMYYRYQFALLVDRKQATPILWSISRIYERTSTGGALRSVELFRPQLLGQQFKEELFHRARTVCMLFIIALSAAALLIVFGFYTQSWSDVPKGWPTSQLEVANRIAETKKNRENITPSNSHRYKDGQAGEKNANKIQGNESIAVETNSGTTSGTQEKQTGASTRLGRESQTKGQNETISKGQIAGAGQAQVPEGQQGEQAQTGIQGQMGQNRTGQMGQQAQVPEGQQGQQTQAGIQGKMGQSRAGQLGQQTQSRQQTQPGVQGQLGQQATLRPGQQPQPRQQAQPGVQGQQGQQATLRAGQQTPSGQQTQPGVQGQLGQQAAVRPGQQTKPGQQTQPGVQGQQGQQATLRAGQQTPSGQQTQPGVQGQPGQQATLRPGQQTQSGQQTQPGVQGQAGQQTQSGQQTQAGIQGQQAQARTQGEKGQVGKGHGSGYGTGSPDDIPETASVSEPNPEPLLPSRSTPMVSIAIPSLPATAKDGKGKSQATDNPTNKSTQKILAPLDAFKAGKQDIRSSSPQQYLPNWVLQLSKGQNKPESSANQSKVKKK